MSIPSKEAIAREAWEELWRGNVYDHTRTMRIFQSCIDKATEAKDEMWRERFRKFEKIEDKFGPAVQRESRAAQPQEERPRKLPDAPDFPQTQRNWIAVKDRRPTAADCDGNGRILTKFIDGSVRLVTLVTPSHDSAGMEFWMQSLAK